MRQLLILFTWIVLQSALCCKKKADPPPPKNWKAELPGTTWVGDFRYKSGVYTDSQPFSISFSLSDFTWSELSGDYPGTYTVVENNKIFLNFPTGSTISADIEKNGWTNFKEVTPLGWKIDNLSLSTKIEPGQLINTVWQGQQGSYPMKLQFVSSSQLKVSRNNGAFENKDYWVKGAGIYFNAIGSLERNFGVFVDNGKTFKGIYDLKTSYLPWSLAK
jgi:hypothetical protein